MDPALVSLFAADDACGPAPPLCTPYTGGGREGLGAREGLETVQSMDGAFLR